MDFVTAFKAAGLVEQLRDIVEMDSNNVKIDKAARLGNNYKMILLLVPHIST